MISCRGFSAWRKAGAAAGGTGADECGIGSVGCGKRDTIQAEGDDVRLRTRLAACGRGSARRSGMAAATQRGSAHAAAAGHHPPRAGEDRPGLLPAPTTQRHRRDRTKCGNAKQPLTPWISRISLILRIDSDTNVRNTELDARQISFLRTCR
ncbi:hypothetical protein L3067_02305 [Xanthomonas sp. PPL568]|uniref:hypothetical protein n=1 Tax=Xanthomonas indica TaxID=2912242 RepID=UPI001F56F634|nr:hypothetical protein [Xanthomonas indica]MCI2243442.1 hypothetical protein [Xanthomonas indica]